MGICSFLGSISWWNRNTPASTKRRTGSTFPRTTSWPPMPSSKGAL